MPCSPTSPTSVDTSSERITTCTRSLQDLYDNTEPLSQRRLEDLYEEIGETDNHTLLCLSASYEPMNFEEAAQKKTRRDPINKEVQEIKNDNMRYHISIPKDRKAINGKRIYKTKKNIKRKREGHKAKLVANGYNKKANYDKVFIPSHPPGYHKARNLSSISTQAKNLLDRRKVFLFKWSPRRRIGIHQTIIGSQGEKKRSLVALRLKNDKSSLKRGWVINFIWFNCRDVCAR